MIPPGEFEALLPLACAWAAAEEARILAAGAPLAPDEVEDARRAGVARPEEVRVLTVDRIPFPTEPRLRAAAAIAGLAPERTAGLTIGYGIFIRADCRGHRRVLVHELAHTAQYERFGGREGFLREYLRQCLAFGYSAAPLEEEARSTERRICG